MHFKKFITLFLFVIFKYIGTKVWNNISLELKDNPYSKFKTTYKKQLEMMEDMWKLK